MANYYTYKPGIGAVGEYQASGRPWIQSGATSGETTIDFPNVTKAFTIHSSTETVNVFFNTSATSAEKITVTADQCPVRFELKCRSVILEATSSESDYELYAELTAIGDNYYLTGSGVG